MEEEKQVWTSVLDAKLAGMAEDSKRRDDELRARIAEVGAHIDELGVKLASMAEDSKRQIAASSAEFEKRDEKLRVRIAEMTANISGISDSNGMYAEELFFFALSERKEFAGIHFDDVENDVGVMHKQPGGKRLRAQFDIVMTNAASVAIIEAKYRARKDDVETLTRKKVENFKTLFPEYKDFKIYLGLAALTFEDDAVEEARKYGIGLLQQVGETVEYAADWEVKAY